MSSQGAPRRFLPLVIVIIGLSVTPWAIPVAAGAAGASGLAGVRPGALAPGNAPPGSVALGSVPSTQEIQIGVVLEPSNGVELQSLLRGLYDPTSPEYHQWLSPAQFMARFGPSPAEVSAVESWLGAGGVRVSLSRFTVEASAPAGQLSSILGTSFERYRTAAGKVGFLAQQTPLVPSSLAGSTVKGILGLNTFAPFEPHNSLAPASLGTSGSSSQPNVDGLTPCAAAKAEAAPGYYTLDALGAAYGIGSLLTDHQNGQGQTIALYELGSHSAGDVATYESCFGLTNPVSTVAIDGGGGSTGGNGTVEADVDIEQAATQAPGASIVSYEGPNTVSGAFDVWNAIVSTDTAQVVSTSWGLCEPLSGSDGFISSFTTLFAEAAVQGQTVLAASGDSGAEDCFSSNASTALEVDYPASDPNVTAVGGTSLLGPGNEVTWNANGAAGGGGISRDFPVPSWQPVASSWSTPGNACGERCRQVPDISANAGVGMVVVANGVWTAVGGTSLAAPFVAGLVADRNDGCATGTADLAPTLYGAFSQGLYGSGLTDITSGNNDLNNTYGGAFYPATTGYDVATGLGSPEAPGLSCPEVTAVTPGNSGSQVTVSGLGLEHATVSFGTTVAQVLSATATSATVLVPTGSGTVTVSGTSALGSGTQRTSFTYGSGAPPPTIAAVGTLANKAGNGTTTLAVSPQHLGDLLVLVVKVASTTVTATTVTGGGVGTWTRAEGPYTGYAGNDLEIWTGVVTATGASTITVAYSASVTAIYTGLASEEFSSSSGSSTTWSVDTAAGISNPSSTTVTLPKLTPTGTGELYFGYGAVANTGAAGTTSGFTYSTTADADVSAWNTNVSSALQPTATQAPAGVSGAAAVLLTASGTTSVSPPTVTAVSPTSGPTAGGTSVGITGTNFTGATAVKFGASAASTFTVNSATSITATAPAGAAGTVDVTVTTPGGTSTTSSADHFAYVVSPPTVTAVSPTSGPTAGGTSVGITGTNFTGATAVKFGASAASTFTVNSATSITATAPAGAAGTVDVTVTATGGTSTTSSADRFTYTTGVPPPTIAAVGTLANKAGNGTTTLAVSPQHLGDLLVLVVKVASTTVTATTVTGGGVGTWTRAEGPYTGYAGNDLEIWTGVVTATGASTITVAYSASVTAIYTGLASEEFSSSSGSSTTWSVDTAAGISNPSSTTVTLPKLTPTGTGELYFGYGAVANTGAAGTTSGFTYSTTADADVSAWNTNVSSALQPTATQAPAGVSGAAAVLLTASGTTSVSPPTVTAVSPTSGPTAGGTSVGITGTNFTGATAVKFGASAASTFTVNSATSITATAPAGAAGTVDVTVTATGGTSTTSSADRFTYTTGVPPPTIAAVGTLANKAGNGTTTLAVSPQHLGDLLVLVVKVASTTVTATTVTGGGVGTWTRAEGPYTGYAGNDLEIWTGVVTATGASTITVAYSASVTAIYTGLASEEFSSSSGSSTTWSVDTAAGISNPSSTTVTLPKLTPTGTGELYFGYGAVANTGAAGTTSGFTYSTTADADVSAWNTNVSSALQPTATQAPAGVSGAVAVLIKAG